jgi:chorismate dehydratase
MMRIGCVKYLNARPLISGWPGEVEFDHPSALCQRLANGELDVALVSSFEFLRNPIYQIVDDISISSDGPVYSVIVSHHGQLSKIEVIQLDPASKTSVNLLRCLLAELGLDAHLTHDEHAGGSVPPTSGAQLLIGDQAIQFRQRYAGEFRFWDLGEQWKKLVGLPFVYALWLIRPEIPNARAIAERLRRLRDDNLASLDDLITRSVAGGVDRGSRNMTEFLSSYYREHIRFTFGEREKQGLQRFATMCVKHGLLPSGERTFSIV